MQKSKHCRKSRTLKRWMAWAGSTSCASWQASTTRNKGERGLGCRVVRAEEIGERIELRRLGRRTVMKQMLMRGLLVSETQNG